MSRMLCGAFIAALSRGLRFKRRLPGLKGPLAGLPLHPVIYDTPGTSRRTPTLADLVTKKRTMFAYKQEVRIVRDATGGACEGEPPGYGLQWNPEEHLEAIHVHPEADSSCFETVASTVEHYAAALKNNVSWSAMKLPPPF